MTQPTAEQDQDTTDLTTALQTAVLAVPLDIGSDVTGPDVPEPSFRDDIQEGDSEARTGPPKVGEWQTFFSRIVIKYGTDLYMNMMLRDIEPDELTPAEIAQLGLSSDERKAIARPFAEFANKSKLARKHGRMIVSSADSVESAMILMRWGRTVSRIGRKHRKPKVRPVRGQHQHVNPFATQNGSAPVNGNLGSSPLPSESFVVVEGFAGN